MTALTEQRENIGDGYAPSLPSFLRETSSILHAYFFFHLSFILLGSLELFFCLIFFNLLTRSSLLAVTLAGFLITLFCYFILRIYFQSRKPARLLKLCEKTVGEIEKQVQNTGDDIEKKLLIASALCRLSGTLKDAEYMLYKPPKALFNLSYTFEKFGCWLHGEDIHMLREWLFTEAVDIYICLIKKEPKNLHFHIALANTYVMLSGIYASPKKNEFSEDERWISPEKNTDEMHQKFMLCAKRAIEEFKILDDYAPNDPWVYTQLAYSYRDLQMPEEEIKAYEMILRLVPNDKETLYKLGVLYFEQGMNVKGLRAYDELKAAYPKKAEALIKYYGAYSDSIEWKTS